MKKLALVLGLVLTLAAGSYAQSEQKVYTLGVDTNYNEKFGVMSDTRGKPITGKVVSYYKDGKIETESLFKNGKREGLSKLFYENGNLKMKIPYKNNAAEGLAEIYYESERIMYESFFKKGKKEGLEKYYYENGKIRHEINYENGKREGAGKSYFPNGAILDIIHKDGKVVSGYCTGLTGKRTPLTIPEINYWNNGETIYCE
jgi:antitoxin component YwqK of YwqJK toxin-antitoxin module